jgi:hypothetical protein
MHKFHLGQAVAYRPPSGTLVPSGTWAIIAKLPERNGEHRIHHTIEQHERIARECELVAIVVNDAWPSGKAKR